MYRSFANCLDRVPLVPFVSTGYDAGTHETVSFYQQNRDNNVYARLMPSKFFPEEMKFRALNFGARITWPCNPLTDYFTEDGKKFDQEKHLDKEIIGDGPNSRGASAWIGHDIEKNYYNKFLDSGKDGSDGKLNGCET